VATCGQCERFQQHSRTQVEQLVASVNGSIEIHREYKFSNKFINLCGNLCGDMWPVWKHYYTACELYIKITWLIAELEPGHAGHRVTGQCLRPLVGPSVLAVIISARIPLLRFVVASLCNTLCNKSTTNTWQLRRRPSTGILFLVSSLETMCFVWNLCCRWTSSELVAKYLLLRTFNDGVGTGRVTVPSLNRPGEQLPIEGIGYRPNCVRRRKSNTVVVCRYSFVAIWS